MPGNSVAPVASLIRVADGKEVIAGLGIMLGLDIGVGVGMTGGVVRGWHGCY